MLRRSKNVVRRRLFTFCIMISCSIPFLHFLSTPSSDEQLTSRHRSVIYNLSDSFMMTNLIDQFLDSKDEKERGKLWSLLVQSWLKSFELYVKRTEAVCSVPSSSLSFIADYLNEYTDKLFLTNADLQNHLIHFGLFFDYDLKSTRLKTHHRLSNLYSSPCIYFELIILIMKVQFVLFELQINYFIGRHTLLGSLRHHDIVPWHSIVEFNLPLNGRSKFMNNINRKFQLELHQVNETYLNKQEIGLIYKVFIENQLWPQIEIYFYDENSTEIFDSYDKKNTSTMKIGSLRKTDVFPLQLRPFGPILLPSIYHPQAMISQEKLDICESLPWDHQLGKETDIDYRWQMPCIQLHNVYSFIQTRFSWRRGYCEETLHTLSYFRYTCQHKLTRQFGYDHQLNNTKRRTDLFVK